MRKTKIDIPDDTRGKVAEILNDRLADTIDLKSQAKQAHWEGASQYRRRGCGRRQGPRGSLYRYLARDR